MVLYTYDDDDDDGDDLTLAHIYAVGSQQLALRCYGECFFFKPTGCTVVVALRVPMEGVLRSWLEQHEFKSP